MKKLIALWVLLIAFCAFMACFFTGCAAMQPVAHFDSEGYSLGVTGTWEKVYEAIKSVVDPDRETLSK